ncbi:enhancer of polycomb-like-domain-containing protein [Cerioporus squamosus]|nr:enhancer of polycomb-like-domain-containing protein [Cerioporus squamosus]
MPRATHPGPAALRNRNRVTNKTRLKVIRDTIEADSIVLMKTRRRPESSLLQEHHLQAVLSAAASRHQAGARSTRSGDKEKEKDSAPAAYIPTPDSTGIVQNYEELYPPGRWRDPISYVKSSDTVEEATSFALANGFIYYMDERDKEWLDKNNEQARGEGMSSQAAATSSTRSGRSAKAKGKEPDVVQPVTMTEDEFELVMAIFEKVTHEKTEFLHHGIEQGAPFPPFSDYYDTFANHLQPDMFAVYSVPEWVPQPPQLHRLARIIYSYWRERRLERGGHRIIPAVNLDESDTKNESYICFRRREIKAVRKTRASQASFSDRMVRLQNELATALDIVRLVHQRENCKRESFAANHKVWDKRVPVADLKRLHPSLGSKEDDELFLDRERPPKKQKTESGRPSLKLRHPRENGEMGSPIVSAMPQVRPKEILAAITSQVEQHMQQCKERDSKWEDVSDYPYQPSPAPYGCRLFRELPPRPLPASSVLEDDDVPTYKYSVRLRTMRGGRVGLDRRAVNFKLKPAVFGDDEEAREHARRLQERFRYDDDEGLAVGAAGKDDQDRRLIDEYQPKHLTVTMSLLQFEDSRKFETDQSVKLSSGEIVKPFALGPQQQAMAGAMRPPNLPLQRPLPPPSVSSAGPSQLTPNTHNGVNGANGTPVSVPTQVKKLAQPNPLAHLRISSNGGLRVVSGQSPNGTQPPTSPHATPPSSGAANGVVDTHSQGSPQAAEKDVKLSLQGSPNGVSAQPDALAAAMTSPSPTPSKPLSSTASVNVPNLPNGYHIPAVNGYPAIPKAGYMHPNARANGLNLQQMQSLSAMLPDNNVNIALRQQGYVMPNGAYPMQMAGARPMQWPMAGQHSPPSNRTDGIGVDGNSVSSAGSPTRTPSAAGLRAPQMSRGAPMPNAAQVLNAAQGMGSPAGNHIARLAPHSPSPHMLSPNLAAAQMNVHPSPTRTPQPAIPTPSPSLQSRQLVGGSGAAGY